MAKKSNFFRTLVEKMNDENTSLMEDGLSASEFSGYIDTGSLSLNALISGSIYGGIPNNKCIAFAGETSTGKTFVMLGILKHFLDENPDAGVVYYDTEAAVTRDMMKVRGIDTSRVIVVNLAAVQEFHTHALNMLNEYAESTKPPFLMVLDSLGQLTSLKSMTDATEGKYVRDMTLQQLLRGTFRNIRLKLAHVGVPLLVTNHTYAAIGKYGNVQEISGGGGLKFAADDIIMLSGKVKEKNDEGEVTGNEIKALTWKSRLSRENQYIHLRISYDTGLDRFYGLDEIAINGGLLKKSGNRWELPDGSVAFLKDIVWSPDLLEKLETIVKKKFSYGINLSPEVPLSDE
jgi:RecA/RadA recombinase